MPAASPELVSFILGFIAIEAVGLVLIMRRLGLRRFILSVMAFLVSGAFLMEAVRCALGGVGLFPIEALLLGALLAHLACLALAYRALGRSD
ncbi:MAG: hypothetical protein AAF829_07460 [Pseudomonadota bacterium]